MTVIADGGPARGRLRVGLVAASVALSEPPRAVLDGTVRIGSLVAGSVQSDPVQAGTVRIGRLLTATVEAP